MTILFAAMALASAPSITATQPVSAAPHAKHAQHGQQIQPGAKQSEGCCCKKGPEGGKMACCAEHGKGHAGKDSGHDASH